MPLNAPGPSVPAQIRLISSSETTRSRRTVGATGTRSNGFPESVPRRMAQP